MEKNERKIKKIGTIVISLFVFAYLLNFFWESFHSVFLYEGHNFNAAKYVFMVGYVSIIDGLLILGSYFLISFLWRDFFWIKEKNIKPFTLFIIINLIVALIIEYRALFILEKWSYNDLMPTIFGIGLSPLVQLSITGIIAVWFTGRFIGKFEKFKR